MREGSRREAGTGVRGGAGESSKMKKGKKVCTSEDAGSEGAEFYADSWIVRDEQELEIGAEESEAHEE